MCKNTYAKLFIIVFLIASLASNQCAYALASQSDCLAPQSSFNLIEQEESSGYGFISSLGNIIKRFKVLAVVVFTVMAMNIQAEELCKVTGIIDGDTVKVLYKGKIRSVRFIGVDTPESRGNRKAIGDARRTDKDIKTIVAMGKKATKYLKTLVKKGDLIILEFDVEKQDFRKRLLAYAYLIDGTMLNEAMVRSGNAGIMTFPPNVKKQKELIKAYIEARAGRRGLWSDSDVVLEVIEYKFSKGKRWKGRRKTIKATFSPEKRLKMLEAQVRSSKKIDEAV